MRVVTCFSHSEPLPQADVWLVIDLLRATTTITTFFERGGKALIPAATVDEAFERFDRLGQGWLLMGERHAKKVQGFDLGNSPLDLMRVCISSGEGAIMTTTNGTKALLKAYKTGKPVLAASARNLAAVRALALEYGNDIGILCAGLYGRASLDDTALAGLYIRRFLSLDKNAELDDPSRLALMLAEDDNAFKEHVRSSEHAKILYDLGLDNDIEFALEIDASKQVAIMEEVKGFAGLR